jgi:hypothetical protein
MRSLKVIARVCGGHRLGRSDAVAASGTSGALTCGELVQYGRNTL